MENVFNTAMIRYMDSTEVSLVGGTLRRSRREISAPEPTFTSTQAIVHEPVACQVEAGVPPAPAPPPAASTSTAASGVVLDKSSLSSALLSLRKTPKSRPSLRCTGSAVSVGLVDGFSQMLASNPELAETVSSRRKKTRPSSDDESDE